MLFRSPEQLAEQKTETDLSWEQLESIINRLPDGYGKVFRLNVLQGLSHKEIAKLLGISHLTSASQLHHAKALLRRMIYQYRMEMGIFSVVIAIIFIVYNFISRRNIQEGTILPSNDKILSSNNTIIDFSTEQPDSIKKNRETSLNPSLHNSIPLAEEKEIAKVEIKEVRKVGLELGIPDKLVFRQPFPGPGLAVRIVGDITREKLEVLREADAIDRKSVV